MTVRSDPACAPTAYGVKYCFLLIVLTPFVTIHVQGEDMSENYFTTLVCRQIALNSGLLYSLEKVLRLCYICIFSMRDLWFSFSIQGVMIPYYPPPQLKLKVAQYNQTYCRKVKSISAMDFYYFYFVSIFITFFYTLEQKCSNSQKSYSKHAI